MHVDQMPSSRNHQERETQFDILGLRVQHTVLQLKSTFATSLNAGQCQYEGNDVGIGRCERMKSRTRFALHAVEAVSLDQGANVCLC
jgi:hypothetical protein